MDNKDEERLLRWFEEIESEEAIENNTNIENSVRNDDACSSDRSTPEDPFCASESEYEPSSAESESSEDETNFQNNEDVESEDNDQLADNQLPSTQQQVQTSSWVSVTGDTLNSFTFTGNPSVNIPEGLTPIEIYRMIITDDILDLVILETNRNAKRQDQKWKNVDSGEMLNFFAIIMYMGLVKYPKISDYWSKKMLYRHCFVRHVMPRNRFQSLLRYIHFADNLQANKEDRLYKIKPFVDVLTAQFKNLKTPSEVVSIDESMVPFRGRLLFRQYIPSKASKYGIKLFKLCDDLGYTYDSEIYKGKSDTQNLGRKSNTTVMNLLNDYLDQGRTLVADNFYNNIELTRTLLSRNTHVVGTLRKNTKDIPKEILSDKKMKRGDIKGKENGGIVVGNWKDKRPVRFITTRHSLEMENTQKKNRKGEPILKPSSIIFYNRHKAGIDLSDQMSSYFTVLRRTIRWYHKVAFEYLFGAAVVNALILYQTTNNTKIQISEFREHLVSGLLSQGVNNLGSAERKTKHILQECVEKTKDNRKKRKRCVGCYEKEYAIYKNSKMAAKHTKLVTTFCAECPEKPSYCLDCFQKKH